MMGQGWAYKSMKNPQRGSRAVSAQKRLGYLGAALGLVLILERGEREWGNFIGGACEVGGMNPSGI